MSEISNDTGFDPRMMLTCREAMDYTLAEQVQRWRGLLGMHGERDARFRLAEVAWVSAMNQTTHAYAMASATRALLQGASIPAIVAALGVADVEAFRRMWQPWAQAQPLLFIQGHGAVSPQDCARVGRLLAKAQL
ncbi:hypothetical protein [Nonomuraea endophytica]|uniref:Uncharacterized protein n=1 Tax=Nonomuraea endophytica TaxID=714136 RepID=A0A7W8EJ62_9ACTN|nr:hypothetical protein [Nonomuraea endophytica]MBB5081309.1 hypothetical protein [Nonomuraea endophytica]